MKLLDVDAVSMSLPAGNTMKQKFKIPMHQKRHQERYRVAAQRPTSNSFKEQLFVDRKTLDICCSQWKEKLESMRKEEELAPRVIESKLRCKQNHESSSITVLPTLFR
jgi:hypothetical protein